MSSRELKARIRASYGENHEYAGQPDPALTAKCENGAFVGRKEGDTLVFKGIPFALPPTGALRWKRPEPVGPDDRAFEAYYNGKTPIQTEWPTEPASYYPQGEDCLYLNIWINADRETTGKAVMVFFHGGSYGWGGTADPMYDGKNLVDAHPDIVLVTAEYRTGMMGFVDFSEVPGGEDYPDAPNLGLLDQIEALRWVRRNIAAFGGDPELVTIFGESAGGGSVSLLPLIPEARGLFKRSIAESGSVALTFSKEECRSFTQRLLKSSGLKTMAELAAMTEDKLREVNEKVNAYNNFPQRDGKLLPEDLYGCYDRGESTGTDLLMGTNANEMNYWVGEIGGLYPYRLGMHTRLENDMRVLKPEDRDRVNEFMKKPRGRRFWIGGKNHDRKMWRITELYNELMFRLPMVRQAEGHSRNGGKVYLYYWQEPSRIPFRGACHASELIYVFGNLDNTIYNGVPGDPELCRTVQAMWTRFAKEGKPGMADYPWPAYTEKVRATMVLDRTPHVERDVLRPQRRLLTPLLDYKLCPSYGDMDYNVPFIRKRLWIAGGVIFGVLAVVALILLLR